MSNSYFNTTNESGTDLSTSEKKAKRQDEYILDFFKYNALREFTPSEIHSNIPELHHAPLTSVRRAITNLTDNGLLIKTIHQREGLYGKKTFTWKLKPTKAFQPQLF